MKEKGTGNEGSEENEGSKDEERRMMKSIDEEILSELGATLKE